jgi:hypothetical protein
VGYLFFAVVLTYALLHFGFLESKSLGAASLGGVLGLVYCLLPDIDSPSSKARRGFDLFMGTLSIGLLLAYLWFWSNKLLVALSMALILLNLSLWFLRHRGLTHKPVFGVIVSLPLLYFSWIMAAYALTGFISHLTLDRLLRN